MLACPRCGRENADDARFCNACAEPLTSEAVASGDAIRAVLHSDPTEEPNPALAKWPDDEAGQRGAYVRWEGFPFSPLRTVEMTYGQFVLGSILAFVVIGVVVLAAVYQGQAVLGGLLLLVTVAMWIVSWRVGLD